MKWFKDIHGRQVRLTNERQEPIEAEHPEMSGQIDKIQETCQTLIKSFDLKQIRMLSYFLNIMILPQLRKSIYVW